ncbi:MAG: FKBP-type peptidyl-prolyl cis-trans isomerase [Gemmatimonadota bacterium]
MRTLMLAMAVAVAGSVWVGCAEEGVDQSRMPREYRVAEDYARALDVELGAMTRRPTGVYVQDLVEGEGMRADSGDIVTVHYTGWLPQGTEFDSSRDGEPFEFALGYGQVISGWDQGVVGMRVGGERRLVIPPGLAYGASGTGPIPGNATLVFDVELLDVVNRVPEGGAADTTGADAAGG